MLGVMTMVGVASLAVVYLGVFFCAICKECRHVKICRLLRISPGEGSDAATVHGVVDELYKIAHPFVTISGGAARPRNEADGVVLQMEKPQGWRRAG